MPEQYFSPDLFVAEDWQNISADIIKQAAKLGASDSFVVANIGRGFTVTSRLGAVETVEYQQGKSLDITVYFGHRTGSVSITDTRPASIATGVEAACHIARFTQDDPCAGLAERNLLAFGYPQINQLFPWSISVEDAIKLICSCEKQALQFDSRLVNSDGAMLTTHEGWHFYANSADFTGFHGATNHSMNVVLVAQQGQEMQRDYSYTVAVDPDLLTDPVSLAQHTAIKTISRLGSRSLPTKKMPVLFCPDEARRLLKIFVAAISGSNLFRKSSFLLDCLGKQIFPDYITICENPFLEKGLGSAPFDEDGVSVRDNVFVANGVLENYALSVYSARKLGMSTTGNAGGVHNLTISSSKLDFPALLKKLDTGLFVTEILGHGVNLVTGDYSHGACGFFVKDGEIQYPVEEITIAGNLRDMFANLVAVGNDIDRRGAIHTGSLLFAEMTVAGS